MIAAIFSPTEPPPTDTGQPYCPSAIVLREGHSPRNRRPPQLLPGSSARTRISLLVYFYFKLLAGDSKEYADDDTDDTDNRSSDDNACHVHLSFLLKSFRKIRRERSTLKLAVIRTIGDP